MNLATFRRSPIDTKGEQRRKLAREHKIKLNEFSKIRIPDLEREYLAYSRANKAENTCEIIQLAFWKFREYAHDIPLENVNYQMAEGFKAWLLQRVNGTTTNMNFRALKAGFEYAVKIEWLERTLFGVSSRYSYLNRITLYILMKTR
ncbi:MAG: phage integrase SAM-like domain-containing protein [bacterium]|nr:phage integrase SAM-like domain-containing protein [bacterium]